MSTLSVETIKSLAASTPPAVQDSAGTEIGTFCRAWVNFNGTGTVAIRAAFNVSSITDNGVGDYTVNMTTALSDGSYAVAALRETASGGNNNYAGVKAGTTPTSTAVTVLVLGGSTPVPNDVSQLHVSIFR